MKKFAWLVFVVFSLVFISMLPSGVSALAGGEGSSGTPIQITNCVQLQEMNNNLTASYVLMNDIDCSDTVKWNSGAGFVPIGTPAFTGFTGTFDGQNHKITGLFINRPLTDYVGLFGYTGIGAIIINVSLVNVNITGNSYVGGLVGWNSVVITNSYSTGSVTGVYQVGGLTGNNPGVITNSYSTGSVSGSSYLGGLTGCNSGAITNSYATGSVNGVAEVGGLVGVNYGGYILDGAITNSYATGRVTCSYAYAGGLVAVNTAYWWLNPSPGALTTSYWDIETSGMSGSSGGTGKTTAEMMQQSTYETWDFVNIWAIKEGVSYPYFLWQIPPVLTCPSGMVSYWKFDEGSGTTAYDVLGVNNGQLIGGPIWTTGKVRNALQFDGVNDYVSVGNLGNFYLQGTIEFWMNPTVVENYRNPFTTNYPGYNAAIRFEENSAGNFGLAMGDDSGLQQYGHTYLSSGLLPNKWYHVVLTWNKTSNKATGYLNGVQKFDDWQPIWPTTIPNVTIGGILWVDRSWKGLIDEVAIYNRALTADEIQQHYQAGLQGEGYCDNIPPVIAAHDDVFAEATSSAGAVVNYVLPTATDNYDASVIVTCTPASGSTFALGDTTVTCNAEDEAGNQATPTSFIVHVVDTTRPVPDVASLPTISDQCSVKITTIPTATDICDGKIIGKTNDPLEYMNQGTYLITWIYSDKAGNVAMQTQTVVVKDTTPPSISCPANITLTSILGRNSATVNYAEPTVIDNCTGPITVISSPASGSSFPVGTTIVTSTATDASANKATCSFTITVITPQGQTQILLGRVRDIVTAGVLSNGEGNSLTSKLENAMRQMDRGNANASSNELNAFINEVNSLIKSRRISQAQGQPLINTANDIIARLTP